MRLLGLWFACAGAVCVHTPHSTSARCFICFHCESPRQSAQACFKLAGSPLLSVVSVFGGNEKGGAPALWLR